MRSAANLSSGGDNVDVTDETHQSLKDLAVAACRAIPGTELVGVDILLADHRIPADQQDVNICEVNSRPGISAHDYPMYGKPRQAARMYVERLIDINGLESGTYRPDGRYTFTIHGRFNPSRYSHHLDGVAQATSLKLHDVELSGTTCSFGVTGTALGAAVLNCHATGPTSSRIAVVGACKVERID